jgi:hypothetical protein
MCSAKSAREFPADRTSDLTKFVRNWTTALRSVTAPRWIEFIVDWRERDAGRGRLLFYLIPSEGIEVCHRTGEFHRATSRQT